MTEKKFLSYIFTEGILLTTLGILMLLLPKITTITFGMMLCLSFIIYGGYKVINAIFSRNYIRHFLLNIILGLILIVIGGFLFIAPMFNLIFLTSFIGVYFLLESISSVAFTIQNKKTLHLWWTGLPVALFQFLFGLIIIIGLPTTALWLIGILAGINFLIFGMSLISCFIATKYSYSI